MTDDTIVGRSVESATREVVRLLGTAAEHLPAPELADEFGAFFDQFADARVVLLGEATHGTSEFYRARAAITRRLIERHGFNVVAVEADWPDARRIDRYIRHHPADKAGWPAFARFPNWMWRNNEVRDFADWLRAHNAKAPADDRVEFRGLDVYSLGASIAAVLTYLDRVDPAAARIARDRYSCLTPWQDNPAAYGQSVMLGGDDCETEAVQQLQELLEKRIAYLHNDGDSFFDAAQNARIIRAAEHYYRIMYRGAKESWNLRDRHMFDTLTAVLRHRGPNAKAVVWAHNSHIGNAAATSMGWAGEFNIGELCRIAFGTDAALIGFGTDRGTVAAASDWGSPMEVKTVRPSRPDSYEHLFRLTGLARSLTVWRDGNSELRDALWGPRLERAIGVVYRPETELLSHYFEAVLVDQFDAFVWFEETRAVTPLPTATEPGMPETYPFGI
jgi:erythromycin esterase-like protein